MPEIDRRITGQQCEAWVEFDKRWSLKTTGRASYFYCGAETLTEAVARSYLVNSGCSGAACSLALGCSSCPPGRTLYQVCTNSTICADCEVRSARQGGRASARACPQLHLALNHTCHTHAQALGCLADQCTPDSGCSACAAGYAKMPLPRVAEAAKTVWACVR